MKVSILGLMAIASGAANTNSVPAENLEVEEFTSTLANKEPPQTEEASAPETPDTETWTPPGSSW